LDELDQQLANLPEVSRLEVEGGWYAVLRIPALAPDEQTVLALLERGVWVHPGYFFGMAESGWLVVSLLGPEQEFSAGVALLIEHFTRCKQTEILNLFGTIDYDPAYDYKKVRQLDKIER
jgi:aspartate/methionine/tyrosine aminotransferase